MPGMSLSCSHHQEQRCRVYWGQRQTLTHQQKLGLRQEQIAMKNDRYRYFLGFIGVVTGHTMLPSATCPKCSKVLSVAEIVIGFKNDLDDFTTVCPQCKHRFESTNLVDRRTGEEHAFWCANQTLERLPGLEKLEPEEIKVQHPHIYFSAIFHFGSLLNAFRQKHIEYRREKFDWTTKARLCLGKVSDRDISAIFGVTTALVSEMRRKLHIDRYRGKGSIIPVNQNISSFAE